MNKDYTPNLKDVVPATVGDSEMLIEKYQFIV